MRAPRFFDDFVPTPEAIDVYRRFKNGDTCVAIARDLGVSFQRVHTIVDYMRDLEAEIQSASTSNLRAA